MKDMTLISAIVLLASGCASTYTAPVADAPFAGGTYARYQPAPDPTPGAGGLGGYGGGATVVR